MHKIFDKETWSRLKSYEFFLFWDDCPCTGCLSRFHDDCGCGLDGTCSCNAFKTWENEKDEQCGHDIDILVVNALRFEKVHHSHQLVDDAIAFSRRIGGKRTYLIHLYHDIGSHEIANSRLPEGVEFAYDEQVINC